MSDFVTLFNQYKNQAGIIDDRGACALLSKVLEQYKPERQMTLLSNAIDNNLSINEFALRLGVRVDVSDLKNYLDAKAKAVVPEDVPEEKTEVLPPASSRDPKANLPKAKSTAVPSSNGVVPPSVPVVFKPEVPGMSSNSQSHVDEEPADEDGGGDDGEEDVVTPAPKPQAPRPPRRPTPPEQTKQDDEDAEPTGIKAWFVGRMKALNEWREGLGSGGSLSTKGSSFDFGDFLATKWQMLVMGVLALAVFGLVFFLGPASGGDDGSGGNSVLTFGSLQNVPFVLFVIVIITFVLFLESNDRGDGVDAWLVIVSVTLSSIAMKYKPQLTQITGPGDEPWGWMILGFLYFAPYLIIYIAVAVNRTRNIFASNMFKKLDFTPLYMCFLLFWSLAQAHKYWDFIPNPCLFPEGFYLGVGLIGLLLELSGNMVNLLVAVVGGVVSGLLIFNGNTTIYSIPNYVWVFVIYMLAMFYGFSDSATSQGTINMDSNKNEGGMSFGSTVKTKRFVPYDMYGGMVWLTAIVAIFYYGNPAFSLVSPF